MLNALRALLLSITLCGMAVHAQEVCITIDDLPCVSCGKGRWEQVTSDLLATLQRHRVPAIGFVNEGKLYREGRLDSTRLALLERWLDAGMDLGNHTFGHQGMRGHTVAEYEQDVLRGEELLRPMMRKHGRELKYFRHPFLQTGPTPGARDSLNAMLARHGYTVAPVTFDNDEYMYAGCYEAARKTGNDSAMARLAADYRSYMDSLTVFYEGQALEFLGRPMKHILLVHANGLNAAHLDDILTDLERRGYRFISLAEALTDPAYDLPEATTPYGFSWLRRWRLAAGQRPPWPPEAGALIERCYEASKH